MRVTSSRKVNGQVFRRRVDDNGNYVYTVEIEISKQDFYKAEKIYEYNRRRKNADKK